MSNLPNEMIAENCQTTGPLKSSFRKVINLVYPSRNLDYDLIRLRMEKDLFYPANKLKVANKFTLRR